MKATTKKTVKKNVVKDKFAIDSNKKMSPLGYRIRENRGRGVILDMKAVLK